MRRICHGYADAVLVVGMEDCLGPVHLSSNANMRALAAGYEEQPEAASMPFDRNRSGFVMSQGAAAVLLESDDAAAARGAETLAVLSGFGSSSDAHHPTAPHPEGRGAAQAVREGLADAGMTADDVGHINAHGTSTPAGDAAEAKALAAVFGERRAACADPHRDQVVDRASARGIWRRRSGHRGAVAAHRAAAADPQPRLA